MIDPGSAGTEAVLAELERGRRLGLLGPGPVADHLRHSLGFLPALDEVQGEIADLGSGGGVPGLPLAVARPDLRVVLIDAGARRTAFLRSAVEALELDGRVRVVEGRAEVVGRGPLRGGLDAVVARGFGPPAATVECAAPLLRIGGRLAVSEPPDPAPQRWPEEGVAVLGLRRRAAVVGPPRIQVLEQVAPCPERYPRRDGVPHRRPLF